MLSLSSVLSFFSFSETRNLSLEEAFSIARQKSVVIKSLELDFESEKIAWEGTWEDFYIPQIGLGASVGTKYTLGALPGTESARAENANRFRGFPEIFAGFQVGEYTLFNFWKDRNRFDKARMAFERSKERYLESRREIFFEIIRQYFGLKTETEKLDAAKRSVKIAYLIFQNIELKKSLGQDVDSDLNSARVDFLNAKKDFLTIKSQTESLNYQLSKLLGDDVGGTYNLTTSLQYAPVQLKQDDALKIYLEQSPKIKDANLSMKNAEMDLAFAEKEALPLPKVTLSGVRFGYQVGYFGSGNEWNTSANGNFDVSASLDLSFPFFGSSGFLNRRNLALARIQREKSEIAYFQSLGNESKTEILENYSQIKRDEGSVENLKSTFKASADLLQSLVIGLTQNQTSRLEVRDAILQARQTEFEYKESVLNHLSQKLNLCVSLGMDYLEGDFLEKPMKSLDG